MTLAQFINILYNIVDRMYIGRIPNSRSLALTGVIKKNLKVNYSLSKKLCLCLISIFYIFTIRFFYSLTLKGIYSLKILPLAFTLYIINTLIHMLKFHPSISNHGHFQRFQISLHIQALLGCH